MPLKDLQGLPELFISQPDGKQIKIGKIQETQILSDFDYSNDITEDPIVSFPMHSITFEVRWNPDVDTIYLLIYGRIPSNNWRKMHGWPLRRKKHDLRGTV